MCKNIEETGHMNGWAFVDQREMLWVRRSSNEPDEKRERSTCAFENPVLQYLKLKINLSNIRINK